LDEPLDNSSKIQKISQQMILNTYQRQMALEEVKRLFKDDKAMQPVVENAHLYLDDAEKFQSQGREELAVLSIGYAEGLIDALVSVKGNRSLEQSL